MGNTIIPTIKIIFIILLTTLLYFVTFGRLEAEAPVKTFDSTTSVLVADFIIPKQESKYVNDHIVQVDKMVLTNCEKYRSIVEQYEWNVEIVLQIMKAESGCNTSIVNNNPLTGDYSVGLMQINIYGANAKYRPSEQALKDPAINIAYAYSLWKSSGFYSQWGVCRRSVNCR